MTTKRILYFMPDNPVVGKAGNLTRSAMLLDYLQANMSNHVVVEFLSISDWGEWSEQGIFEFKKRYPSIKLTLINRKISKEHPLKRILFYKLPNLIPKLLRGISVDITNYYFRRKVQNHFNKYHYDKVIMSYSSWGSLAFLIKNNPYLIIDTHDFLTAQSKKRQNKIGRIFQSELNILRRFDEIWTLSIEEKYIYEQFTNSKVVYHPVLFNQKVFENKKQFSYDIIFVASRNPHNIASIHWFLKNVSPHLFSYKIHIIGRICNDIVQNYPNVIKHGMLDDLEEIYKNARIAICPMLSGTGVKIKVIEALSYHIPVVTNTRGVDGLLNKTENGCLVADDELEFANHIKLLMENNEVHDKLRKEACEYMKRNHAPELEKKLFSSLIKR